MTPVLWTFAAILVALGAAAVAATALARPKRPPIDTSPEDADAPLAPLQKLAWWWLGIGVAAAAPFAAAVAVYGAPRYYDDDAIRVPVTVVLAAGFVIYGVILAVGKRFVATGRVVLDERDRQILEAAPRAQVAAILLVVAAWTVGLMEGFREAGAIPVAYAPVIFWCVVLVAMLALPVGILAGYRRR